MIIDVPMTDSPPVRRLSKARIVLMVVIDLVEIGRAHV